MLADSKNGVPRLTIQQRAPPFSGKRRKPFSDRRL